MTIVNVSIFTFMGAETILMVVVRRKEYKGKKQKCRKVIDKGFEIS